MSKTIFMKYLPEIFSKLQMPSIYRNLTHLIFEDIDLYFNVKNNFYEMLTKIKNAQNSLKFGPFDISNLPILILM